MSIKMSIASTKSLVETRNLKCSFLFLKGFSRSYINQKKVSRNFLFFNNWEFKCLSSIPHRSWLSSTPINFSVSRFIPLCSKTLFKRLIIEKEKHNEESLKMFEKFAVGVGVAISNKNFSLLPEMKILYDPLNPDVGTAANKSLTWHELQDREFWFLQKFSIHLEKAGFQEADEAYLKECFSERPVGQGVIANIEPQKFEILRCWVLSDLELQPASNLKPFFQNLEFLVREPSSKKLFKRVVMVTQQRGEEKLFLRLFKDIPSNQLHLLLPPNGLKMHDFYRQGLYITSGISVLFLLSRYAVVWLVGSNHHLGYLPVGFSAFFGLVGVAMWTNFKQRQKRYLSDVLEVIYNRFVVGNQNLLSVVADKVQEETLKGILITYYFLLSDNTTQEKKGDATGFSGRTGVTVIELEKRINSWMESQTGQKVAINLSESLMWLTEMGIVNIDPNTQDIQPLPLHAALKILPVPGHHLSASHFAPVRVEEFDLFHSDLAEATNLEKQDFIDKVTSVVWKQFNKFQRRF